MRLTPQQQSAIRTAVAETFGEDANIWLFGSRVDRCSTVSYDKS